MDQREEKQVQSKGEGEGMQTPHKRRVRYKGTHPRSYQEKYKELNPEKYKDTVERVIQKGGTPAGMHISICVNEILDFFDIQPGQTGVDATLGYGGTPEECWKSCRDRGISTGWTWIRLSLRRRKNAFWTQDMGRISLRYA